jgi:putative sigma-54 modulation protein
VRTIVKGKNYEVSDRVRAYAERKLARLERLMDDETDAVVELSVEHHRSGDASHIVDVALVVGGQSIRGRATAPSHHAGIDDVVDKIERQAVDAREKPRSRARALDEERTRDDTEIDGQDGGEEAGSGPVVKVKRFAIEPMFEEDAIARMEELGHAFFVFVDAETERIAVLYRRRAGDYGVIEPVVGGTYTKGGPVRSAGGAGSRSGTARR